MQNTETKIEIICLHDETRAEETTLTKIVERKVDGSDYDQGRLEDMAATIYKQTHLLAAIIAKLNLSDEELTEMLAGYGTRLRKLK